VADGNALVGGPVPDPRLSRYAAGCPESCLRCAGTPMRPAASAAMPRDPWAAGSRTADTRVQWEPEVTKRDSVVSVTAVTRLRPVHDATRPARASYDAGTRAWLYSRSETGSSGTRRGIEAG
jgi:hypothetical protein